MNRYNVYRGSQLIGQVLKDKRHGIAPFIRPNAVMGGVYRRIKGGWLFIQLDGVIFRFICEG